MAVGSTSNIRPISAVVQDSSASNEQLDKSVVIDGLRLGFDEFGSGERVVVLMPASILARSMHHLLARKLAQRGYRVICLDQLGVEVDGAAPRYERYYVPTIGARLIDVLDALGIESAVLGGVTTGGGAALEAALLAPDRVRGVIAYSPWMEHSARLAGAYWTPLWLVGHLGLLFSAVFGTTIRRIPQGRNGLAKLLLQLAATDPKRALAAQQAFFFDRKGPPAHVRANMMTPALVVSAAHGDPFHGPKEARLLSGSLGDGQLLWTRTLYDWVRPSAKLVEGIDRFLADRWPAGRSE